MASSSDLSIDSTIKLSSGYTMPLLGLGVYQNTGASVVEACLASFEAGYRHIDSAQMYRNEKEVAESMSKSGLKREDVFISESARLSSSTTQVRPTFVDQATKIQSGSAISVASALASSTSQFAAYDNDEFNFGYIDLLLIHDPKCGPDKRLEMWRSFIKARDDGVVRSIGVSNFGTQHLQQIADAGLELPAVNQIELHPFCQQKEIAKWCHDNGVVVQAYCPLLRGRRWDDPTLSTVAKTHGKEAGQVLVRWSLQKGFVPLPKSSQPHRVKSNAELYDFALTEEEMRAIDALDEGDSGALSWNPIHAR